MGNYGAVLVIGILMISIFPFFLTYIDNQISGQEELRAIFSRDVFLEKEAIYSSIKINRTSITWLDNTSFEMTVVNDGKESILLDNFRYISLLVTYYTGGVKRSVFIPYNQTGTSGTGDFWRIISVYDVDISREILNPVNTTIESGAWDPNEAMKIRIYLSTLYPRDPSTEYIIVFSLPNGCRDIAVGDRP